MAVVLRPTLLALGLVAERVKNAVLGQRRERQRRRDHEQPFDALGNRRRGRATAAAPRDSVTRTARSVQVASRTASASSGVLGLGVRLGFLRAVGLPLPRAVEVDDPEAPARYGTCIFQIREWMIAHVGRAAASVALAVELVERAHAVALDVAVGVGVAGARLLVGRVASVAVTARSFTSSHASIQSSSSPCPASIPEDARGSFPR